MTQASAATLDATAVALRPVIDADREFLLALYGSTRADELSVLQWTDDQQHAFLEMQFDIQDRCYRQDKPGASFDIVLWHRARAGRLYVERLAEELRVVDVSLLPEYQNVGVGTLLLQRLMDEAARLQRAVTLHVRLDSPARRLYSRLGFIPVADTGVDLLLCWRAG